MNGDSLTADSAGRESRPHHVPSLKYQGHIVRWLYITNGVLLVVISLKQPALRSIPLYIPLFIFPGFCALLAGLMTRRLKYSYVAGSAIALLFLLIFQKEASWHYYNGNNFLAFANEVSAILFLLIVYFSIRSFRSLKHLLHRIVDQE